MRVTAVRLLGARGVSAKTSNMSVAIRDGQHRGTRRWRVVLATSNKQYFLESTGILIRMLDQRALQYGAIARASYADLIAVISGRSSH